MDTRLNYPEIVKNILNAYADFFAGGGVTSMHTLFDDQHQGYILMDIGWESKRYTHHVVIHIDIIEDKIWIQKDNTELLLPKLSRYMVLNSLPKEQSYV